MTPALVDEAARLLLAARREARTIEALPEACRPRDVDEGYAVQDALIARAGGAVAGWKLGATTPYWQRRAGLAGPMAGRLLASAVYQSAVTLPGARFHLRLVECEYAFELARDLPGRAEPYRRDEVEDAVAAVHGCIEVADSRYAQGLRVDTPSLIADNVLAGALVVGPRIAGEVDLSRAPVRLFLDGRPIAEGMGEHTGGHPILPLVWLAEDRRRRGDGLRAGMLVSTGSTTGALRCPPRAELRAEFVGGAVALRFV